MLVESPPLLFPPFASYYPNSVCSNASDVYIEVLDDTRIHPETYEWARKMAVDALEYDEVSNCSTFCLLFTFLGGHLLLKNLLGGSTSGGSVLMSQST